MLTLQVTIIENLELYGIDAKTLAHTVQVKVACSASATPSQQKNKGPQVVIQGNQIGTVGDLLLSKFFYCSSFTRFIKFRF